MKSEMIQICLYIENEAIDKQKSIAIHIWEDREVQSQSNVILKGILASNELVLWWSATLELKKIQIVPQFPIQSHIFQLKFHSEYESCTLHDARCT